MSRNSKIVVLIVVLIIILFLISTLLFINSRLEKPEKNALVTNKNTPSLENIPGYNNLYKENLKLGNISTPDDLLFFQLSYKINDVKKEKNKVLIEIETLGKQGEKVIKILLVFDQNKANRLFITKVENLADLNSEDLEIFKITDSQKAYSELSKYKNDLVISLLDLPKAMSQDVFKDVKSNLDCNQNFYDYLTGSKEDNGCQGSSFQIYVNK